MPLPEFPRPRSGARIAPANKAIAREASGSRRRELSKCGLEWANIADMARLAMPAKAPNHFLRGGFLPALAVA